MNYEFKVWQSQQSAIGVFQRDQIDRPIAFPYSKFSRKRLYQNQLDPPHLNTDHQIITHGFKKLRYINSAISFDHLKMHQKSDHCNLPIAPIYSLICRNNRQEFIKFPLKSISWHRNSPNQKPSCNMPISVNFSCRLSKRVIVNNAMLQSYQCIEILEQNNWEIIEFNQNKQETVDPNAWIQKGHRRFFVQTCTGQAEPSTIQICAKSNCPLNHMELHGHLQDVPRILEMQ